jgi:hypothetical protein
MLDALASNRKNVINMAENSIATKLQLISNLDVIIVIVRAHIAAMLGEKVITLGSKTSVCCVFTL